MKLYEQISALDDETWIYVGAKVNFLWIGQVKDAVTELALLSKKMLDDEIHRHVPRAKHHMDNKYQHYLQSKADGPRKGESLQDYKFRLEGEYRSYVYSKNNYKNHLYMSENWKHLLTREVKEIYDRQVVEPLGKIIIVEGTDYGWYWDYNEFKKGAKQDGMRF